MSHLQVSISAEEQPNSFFVFNCTGEWSPSNPGGFGGPNPKVTDITKAVLVITPPQLNLPVSLTPGQLDTTQVVPASPPVYTISTWPDFPSTDDEKGYEVLPYMVGNNNNTIPSGKWRVQLEVSGNYGIKQTPFSSKTFLDVVFMNQITCCIDGLQKYINVGNYKDKRSQTIAELNNLLEGACRSKKCGLLDQANGIIKLLEAQCLCPGC